MKLLTIVILQKNVVFQTERSCERSCAYSYFYIWFGLTYVNSLGRDITLLFCPWYVLQSGISNAICEKKVAKSPREKLKNCRTLM